MKAPVRLLEIGSSDKSMARQRGNNMKGLSTRIIRMDE